MNNGGDIIAAVLRAQGVQFLFTLCGGHISPILVGAGKAGIRVIDTRHESTAVFAADAVARLTGNVGVAAVTAGPGVTNSITAIKNAQMAQSPVLLLGGAAPTALQGRGALQDIDQLGLMHTLVKWSARISRVAEIQPVLDTAIRKALEGTPGPVFVEIPVDLLYDEQTVRSWYGADKGGKSWMDKLVKWYLKKHVNKLFSGDYQVIDVSRQQPDSLRATRRQILQVSRRLTKAEKPVMVIGSQVMKDAAAIAEISAAVQGLQIPVFLSGMARGLLGKQHQLLFRHHRKSALREADLVILAGVPCDFRLDYGNHVSRKSTFVSINCNAFDLVKNRRPDVGVLADPGSFLRTLFQTGAKANPDPSWIDRLNARESARNLEISAKMQESALQVNPLHLCSAIDDLVGNKSIIIADGGDFVGTASYIVKAPGPLTWLDPGAFGTLGVGAGFALGAKLVKPDHDVWILFGDGSLGYSLMEYDTFVRHGIGVCAVVGNDGAWSQIARDQVELLGDAIGTELGQVAYHNTAIGLGGKGYLISENSQCHQILEKALSDARIGHPVLVNALLGRSDFRKGSLSM